MLRSTLYRTTIQIKKFNAYTSIPSHRKAEEAFLAANSAILLKFTESMPV